MPFSGGGSQATPLNDHRVTLLAHVVGELFDRLGKPHPEPLALLMNGDNYRDQ